MKSVKPGRGPSMMGGVMGIFMGLFGVFWTFSAASMGAPAPFCMFGVLFIGIAIAQAVYNFKNATSENRYSSFDIVDGNEEEDPLNRHFGGGSDPDAEWDAPRSDPAQGGDLNFCPYCGAPLADDFAFCPKCGKELPK